MGRPPSSTPGAGRRKIRDPGNGSRTVLSSFPWCSPKSSANYHSLAVSAQAFAVFCLLTGAVYLINDILDLSKVEAGKVDLHLTQVNLRTLLEGSIQMVKEKALQARIHLSVHVDGIPEIIHVDERKLKQILYNLLSNAVKFTPEGGAVALSTRPVNVVDGALKTNDVAGTMIKAFPRMRRMRPPRRDAPPSSQIEKYHASLEISRSIPSQAIQK